MVTKSVPPYSIVAGVPAKIIGYRFDKVTAEQIEKTKWYLWDEKKVRENSTMLQNIAGFDINCYWQKFMRQREFLN